MSLYKTGRSPKKKEKEVVGPEATASDFITTTSGMT